MSASVAARTSPPQPAVEVRDVHMAYPGARAWLARKPNPARVEALRGVDMTLLPRQRLALFGENGTGKTTILKIVAGMLIPSRGSVRVGVNDETHAPLRVGYVISDERSFHWRLSGVENLRFFAALDDSFGPAAAGRIHTALEQVGLSGQSARPVGEYSTGMRQRLAVARGLLADPDVLLLDEPTRSLDPAATDAVLAAIRDSLGGERTLLLATNRFEDALALCESVAVLRAGRIGVLSELAGLRSENSLASFVREHLTSPPPAHR